MEKKLRIEDLAAIRDKARRQVQTRQGEGKVKIVVHMGTCGIAAGSRKSMSALLTEITKRDLKDILVTTSGCAGLCSEEPMVTVERGIEAPVKYKKVNEKRILKILDQHVLGGDIVKEFVLAVGSETTR